MLILGFFKFEGEDGSFVPLEYFLTSEGFLLNNVSFLGFGRDFFLAGTGLSLVF